MYQHHVPAYLGGGGSKSIATSAGQCLRCLRASPSKALCECPGEHCGGGLGVPVCEVVVWMSMGVSAMMYVYDDDDD